MSRKITSTVGVYRAPLDPSTTTTALTKHTHTHEESDVMEQSSGTNAERPTGVTRRSVLLGAAAGAGLSSLGLGAVPAQAQDDQPDPEEVPAPGRPLLLRGGTVVTMDSALGVMKRADVLIRNGRVAAVGPDLPRPQDAAVLDVTGDIVAPGFIDTHRHLWQTALRGIGTEWTLTDYLRWMFARLGPLFQPADIYAGGLLGALEALDSGITTVLDWNHNLLTPDHADAAVDALVDAGGRARLAYGRYASPPQDWVTSGDVDRLLTTRFPTANQLVTLQLALDPTLEPGFPERPAWEFARDRELPVTVHTGVWGFNPDQPVKILADQGLLSPSTTYVHASSMADESYRLIADSGATVSVAAESELHAGQGYPPTAALRRFGIPTSLSVDTVAWFSGDLFAAMRATLAADRGLAHQQAHARGETLLDNQLRTIDVLRHATVDGARTLGLADELGSLTPGKRADITVVSGRTLGMTPLNNPVGALVLQAGRGEVDTVIVDGRVVKRRGRLVGAPIRRARRLAEQSRDRLLGALTAAELAEALDPPRR